MTTASLPTSPPVALQAAGGRVSRRLPGMAWAPEGDLAYAQWVEAGRRIGALGRGGQWWVGDWLVYGAGRWGEKYVAAAKITGYDTGSLRNMASLASQFASSRRRDNLTWGHHAAVASLEISEQEACLDLAVSEMMSVADLRELCRARRRSQAAGSAVPAASQIVATISCPHCGGAVPIPNLSSPVTAGSKHAQPPVATPSPDMPTNVARL
jgi:hypothetical protein